MASRQDPIGVMRVFTAVRTTADANDGHGGTNGALARLPNQNLAFAGHGSVAGKSLVAALLGASR